MSFDAIEHLSWNCKRLPIGNCELILRFLHIRLCDSIDVFKLSCEFGCVGASIAPVQRCVPFYNDFHRLSGRFTPSIDLPPPTT